MGCANPLRTEQPVRETRKTLTLFFADIAESTALGERVDAEAVRGVISRYFEDAKAIVEHHGGTVERFLGDALMGVFGLPDAHEDDAFRAVCAAARTNERLRELNAECQAEWGFEIAVRTGINTGEVGSARPRGPPADRGRGERRRPTGAGSRPRRNPDRGVDVPPGAGRASASSRRTLCR